jgi:hypothetical protein
MRTPHRARTSAPAHLGLLLDELRLGGVTTYAHLAATLNRQHCSSCFDVEAEKAGVRYRFVTMDAISWSDRPVPRSRVKRRR